MPKYAEEEEPYIGSFVTLRADGPLHVVAVDPPLPDGLDRTRTYSTKDAAFGYARELWCEHRLPFRDFSDGNTGRDQAEICARNIRRL
jgi:hypothetical protein